MVLPNSVWTPLSSPDEQNSTRRFARSLGLTEEAFYWDSVFNGTADLAHHVAIQLADPKTPLPLFKEAWIALKRRFPIIGAQVIEHENLNGVDFIVDTDRLVSLQEAEFTSFDVDSSAGLEQAIDTLMNGPRRLNKDTLAALIVIRRTDESRYDLIFTATHYVVDGIAFLTLIRNYLDILAFDSRVEPPNLEERLSMAVASDSLRTGLDSNLSRRRWKHAIARVLWINSQARTIGGHTIVNKQSARTFVTPAISKKAIIRLPESLSQSIITACRAKGLTFGNAYLVIAQMAFTRVLYRLRKRGEITNEEWLYRLQQPTHVGGPLNLRPFLSPDWLKNGGETELNVVIGFFYVSLPHIPCASGARDTLSFTVDESGAPPFSDLLSRERFSYRCSVMRQQMASFLNHPLAQDLFLQRGPTRIARAKNAAMLWHRIQNGEEVELAQARSASTVSGGCVFTHGGSSLGNVDRLLPVNYPLPADYHKSLWKTGQSEKSKAAVESTAGVASMTNHPPSTAKLSVVHSDTYLRCRPTELYLGADTTHGRMRMHVFYDGNVYEKELVDEWLEEIRAATIWYLLDGRAA